LPFWSNPILKWLLRSVRDAIAVLTSPQYEKARKHSKHLPRISSKQNALEALRSLQDGGIIEKMAVQPSPIGGTDPHSANKVVFLNDRGLLSAEDWFIWKEKSKNIPRLLALLSFVCVVLVMGLSWFNKGLWLSVCSRGASTFVGEYRNCLLVFDEGKHVVLKAFVWLFLAPLSLILGRTMLFIFTHLFCSRGLWLFPNLLMDDGFLAIFCPLFEWDRHPKESLGLRWRQLRNRMRAEMGLESKHRKNRRRKISRTSLRKTAMYRKQN